MIDKPIATTAATLRHVVAAVVLLTLLWTLREPVLIFFGAILVAAILRAIADLIAGTGLLSTRKSVGLSLFIIVALVVGGLWALGDPLARQLEALQVALPHASENLRAWLGTTPIGQRVLNAMGDLHEVRVPWSHIADIARHGVRVIATLVLMTLMGIYLSFDVGLYKSGLVRLMPPARRDSVSAALDATGRSLKRWLLGQAVMMGVIGTTVAVGLALLGVPLALAIGVIAGLLEFVPYFGPFISGLLATLIAFVHGPQEAVYVAIMFVAVQQIEGHILVPFVQRWAAQLPPVMALAGVLTFGTLFGPLGIVFGTPLTVVAMVLVKRLYVEEALEQQSVEQQTAEGP